MLRLSIYGAGYVGLVTGACFAELGFDVLIVDIDEARIQNLSQGIPPIFEPGLDSLLVKNLSAGRLNFSSNMQEGAAHGLLQFIAVGTPSADDGSADLSAVFAVAKDIGRYMNDYKVIVNKSTVPVGTADQVNTIISDQLNKRDLQINYDVISNPEFLKQGDAINDFMHPDRIIVGISNQRVLPTIHTLYEKLIKQNDCLIIMDVKSAELTKYVANAYLATRISFINEMSQLAEKFGADIEFIRQGIGTDKRIGPHFLAAGCGYGGSCFPKDVRALRNMAQTQGLEASYLVTAEQVNQRQKQILFDKISRYFKGQLEQKIIAVWGLAFKPNTDDMREATSQILINSLLAAGAKVQAFDPVAIKTAQKIFGSQAGITYCSSMQEALNKADVLVIITEWPQFRDADIAEIKKQLRYPAIFDGRNIFNPQVLAEHGIDYYAMGRGKLLI